MTYNFYTTPTGKRSLRKLPETIRQRLWKKVQKLDQEPLSGQRLQGELGFLRSLHMRIQAVDYRVAYEVDAQRKQIIIHYAATRENFYRKLRRIAGQPLVNQA